MAGRIQRSFSKKTQRIAVIGAGPIGLTLSIYICAWQTLMVSNKFLYAIFAADGVYSQIRNKLHQNGNLRQSLTKCDLGYLYIEIPSLCRDLINTDDSGNYIFDKHSFHTFPTKEKCFTVVLPEPSGKFSASFYIMRDAYSKLRETGQLRDYLKSLFPQLYYAVPDFDQQLERKTLRDIVSVKLEPSWSYKDKLCCIGDASHAIFPFYGSGLNTGLEDVSEITSLVEQHDFQWDIIFQEFYRLRKPNTDAIQELTLNRLESFMNEMRDPQYGHFRNALDILNNSYGDSFWSVERLVRFSHVPYSQILKFLKTEKAIVETILGRDESIRRALKEGIRKVERVASTENMIEQMMREHREIVEHIKSPQIY